MGFQFATFCYACLLLLYSRIGSNELVISTKLFISNVQPLNSIDVVVLKTGKEVGLKVGDLVAITLDGETLHIMQQMGGREWLPEMGNVSSMI